MSTRHLTKPRYIAKINDVMPRPQTKSLSATHERVLACLSQLDQQNQVVSIGDLVSGLGLAGASSIVATLRIMQRNGYVTIIGGGERGKRCHLLLTAKGKMFAGRRGVPVLGFIPAGPLSEAVQQCEDVVDLGTALTHEPGDFLLVVKGRSMIGDGILPGDKVLLRPDVQVKNGEVAAVHFGDQYEATLKHVCFDQSGEAVTLRASNEDYQDINVAGKDIQIAGVFRGLIRAS